MSRHFEKKEAQERQNDQRRQQRDVAAIKTPSIWPLGSILSVVAVNEYMVDEGKVFGFIHEACPTRVYHANVRVLNRRLPFDTLTFDDYPSIEELVKFYAVE